MSTDSQTAETTGPRWQPLESTERRVLGVLIEKAKTTPENYPLSLNSVKAGCNQKNNRAPLMQLEDDHVEEALESLRKKGAVAQIQGGSRVDKYRHLAYEWLGVEKVELAVMAELLLRGTQTVGELRGRAARMEPIKDLAELQPTLDSLVAKKLVVFLSPPGRGSVVTHGLYLERELEKVQREAGQIQSAAAATPRSAEYSDARPAHSPTSPGSHMPARSAEGTVTAVRSTGQDAANVSQEIRKLREELAGVRSDLAAARAEFETTTVDLRRDLDDLMRQLGN